MNQEERNKKYAQYARLVRIIGDELINQAECVNTPEEGEDPFDMTKRCYKEEIEYLEKICSELRINSPFRTIWGEICGDIFRR
jgi:hypothetical protein